MADAMTVQIMGLEALTKRLGRIAAEVRGPMLEAAVRAGALPFQTAAQANAPVLSGTLRRSIHTEVERRGDEVRARVGTNLPYARQREYGGTIRPVRGPYLMWRTPDGRFVRARSVTQRATPYLRPAFDTQQGKAQAEAVAVLGDLLARAGV